MRVFFPTRDQPAKVVQQSESPLDDPAAFVSTSLPTGLCFLPVLDLSARTDSTDSPIRQTHSQRLAVSGFVIDHALRLSILQCQIFQQWLDQDRFIPTCGCGLRPRRSSLRIDSDQQLWRLPGTPGTLPAASRCSMRTFRLLLLSLQQEPVAKNTAGPERDGPALILLLT